MSSLFPVVLLCLIVFVTTPQVMSLTSVWAGSPVPSRRSSRGPTTPESLSFPRRSPTTTCPWAAVCPSSTPSSSGTRITLSRWRLVPLAPAPPTRPTTSPSHTFAEVLPRTPRAGGKEGLQQQRTPISTSPSCSNCSATSVLQQAPTMCWALELVLEQEHRGTEVVSACVCQSVGE